MKIKYYGTGAGAGIPEIFCSCRVCEQAREERGKNIRTRSQAVIDDILGIDFSVDEFAHTIWGGLDMRRLRAMLITHSHHDHFMPADVISRAVGMTEPIHFYFTEEAGKGFNKIVQDRKEAFASGARKSNGNEVLVDSHFVEVNQTYEILDYKVTPLLARHSPGSGSVIYIIEKDGKKILWAHDTGKLKSDAWRYIESTDICFDFVSLDCTLKRGEQITQGHMDVDWCIETVERLRAGGHVNDRTVVALSHIGHLVERTHDELAAEAAEVGMIVAYDGMELEI